MLIGPPFGTHLALAAAAFGRTRTMWGRPDRRTSSTAAFAEAVDAAQRTGEFLPHSVERDFKCCALSDQHIIMAGAKRVRRGEPDELAQAAAHPVALDRIADLFADGETNPRLTDLCPVLCLQDKTAGMSSHTIGSRARSGSLANGPKVTPAFQPLHCSDFGMTGFEKETFANAMQPKYRARRQALSLLRPRARRAAKTLRPPLLAIRARKPWRRLRTSLLG